MSALKSIAASPARLAAAAAIVLLPLALIASQAVPADAAGGSARVKIVGFDFKPGTLHVSRGTRVVFANASRSAHTATRDGSFDTGRIPAGKSATVRFGRSGTFAYHCTIHPSMNGKIVVG